MNFQGKRNGNKVTVRKELEQEIDWGRRFQRMSQMNFEEMEQQISDYVKAHHAVLDYTAQY